MRRAPSCVSPQPSPLIGERPRAAERRAVVDEPDAGLPRQREEAVADDRDAFAEVLGIDLLDLEHFAVLELDLADARAAVEPGALVEHAVDEREPLRERLGIVGKDADDAVAGDRRTAAGAAAEMAAGDGAAAPDQRERARQKEHGQGAKSHRRIRHAT